MNITPSISVESAQEGKSPLASLEASLFEQYRARIMLSPFLSRELVSFQANKNLPFYRWYRFKEAFSAGLVEFLLSKYAVEPGKVLDPFAGSGTTLFAAADMGFDAEGIELLPLAQEIIRVRQLVRAGLSQQDIQRLMWWAESAPWNVHPRRVPLNELSITRGAYPPPNHDALERYLSAIEDEAEPLRSILRFAALCILEHISYTRKDGQYLRWDYRSGKRQGKRPFNKGPILDFDVAIRQKLREILDDLTSGLSLQLPLLPASPKGQIRLFPGSSLSLMPTLESNTYTCILTSPPYCNRYDYTRTYALELALLGLKNDEVLKLRQEMLSSTVENRPKDLLRINPKWEGALKAIEEHELVQAILSHLEHEKQKGKLNNNGIPRMVRGYFYEMTCIIAESARLLQPGGWKFMVNDNVQYAGISIPVDLILSSLAERFDLQVEAILVLPDEKGNSSQQMGKHGRQPLRKCVYVWRKYE